MRSLLALPVLLLMSALASAQPQPLILKIYDIEGFVRSIADAPVADWALPVREAYRTREDEPDDEPGEDDDVSRADFLLRLIRDSVGPESWDQSGVFMRMNDAGTRLIVRQQSAVHKQIGRFLGGVAAGRRDSYQVEVLVLSARAGSLASLGAERFVMSPARFDALQAKKSNAARVLVSATSHAAEGQRIRLRSQEYAHAVGVQTAQIAQSASRTEPGVVRVPVGLDLFVRPTTLPDGRVNLRVQGTVSDDLQIDEHVSKSAGVAAVQLPSMRVRKFTSSGTVQPGAGLVVGCVSVDDKNPRYVVVRVTGKVPVKRELKGARGALRVYNAGFVTQPYLATPRLELGAATDGARLFESWSRRDEVFGPARNFLLPESAYDLIRQTVTPSYWEDNLYMLEYFGKQLWVSAGSEQHKGIEELLGTLATARGKSLSLSTFCVVATRDLIASKRATGQEGDWLRAVLRDPATIRLHTAVGAAECGSRVEWLDGRESAYIAGAEIDVAQGADIASPTVDTTFSGLYLRLAPCAEGESYGVDYRIDMNLKQAASQGEGLYKSADFAITLPRSGWQNASGHVRCRANRYTLLAEFGLSDDKVALVITRLQPSGN